MNENDNLNVIAIASGATLPAPVVVSEDELRAVALAPEIVAQLEVLAADFAALPPCTAETVAQSDALVRQIAKTARALEAGREAAKRPHLAIGRAIDDAVRPHAARLEVWKRDIEARHQTLRRQQEEERRRAEEQRRAAEEAAARAQAERDAAERRLREQEEEAARALQELAAVTTTEADADTVGALAREQEAAAAAERERVAKLAEEADLRAAEAYTAAMDAHPMAPPVKTSTVVSTVKVLEVFDPTAVPDVVHGVSIKSIDRKALEKLLRAGIAVPGARLVERERTGTRA